MALKLDALGITVRNMNASLQFYRLLGLEIAEPNEGEDHVECTLPNGLRLMWDTEELVKKFDPNWVKPAGQKMGIAFLCDSPDEVNRVFQSLVGAGYSAKLEPFDAFWGQRYASVFDPDGNGVDLFATLG